MEASLSGTFLPEEMEFFAEDTSISVVPNFSLSAADRSTLSCLTGDYGPFQPNIAVEVPLWLALALHKRRKCRVIPPEWMHPDKLQEVYDQERDSSAVFQELPFYYIEIAHLLVRHAKDCFDDLYKVRDLVESVRKLRLTKIDAGLKLLHGAMSVKMLNLSGMECNVIRPFFLGSLNRFHKLAQMEPEPGESQATQTQPGPTRQIR